MTFPSIKKALEQQLNAEIIAHQHVSGGCINTCYQITTTKGILFTKINNSACYPQMLAKESEGLKLLKEKSNFKIPAPIGICSHEGFDILIMEFVESGMKSPDFNVKLGTSLAKMHLKKAEHFGLYCDNYIGSLKQSNKLHLEWTDFFIHQRLTPQLELLKATGNISTPQINLFEKLFKRLDSIFPKEPPALLHGDLWAGNYMCTASGEPCLYDPAVYFGHREMDIAMTQLFGGFDVAFYEAYNACYPLEKGWKKRIEKIGRAHV